MTEDGQRYSFDQVQIGKGLRPLAQHGFIEIDNGTLSLLGSDRQLIDSAPLVSIEAKKVAFTSGRTISLTLNGTKYNASPGWGNHLGTVATPLRTGDVKSAAQLVLAVIEAAKSGWTR
jgi:hypothetical protein